MRIILMMLFLLLPIQAFAGNGSSGGGNIFGDQLNPWFIQNTKTVNYCVKISPEFSDIGEDRVVEIIEDSLKYWKDAFADYETNYSTEMYEEGVILKLGTQVFIRQAACDSKTDLTFQMGFLSEAQRKEINYKQLLGLAQRTAYDTVNLKAKGFIYIAPENGELRPLSPKLHPKPWSHKKNLVLKYSLIHEIGHIFGLQDDHYGNDHLMGAKIVETLTDKKRVDFINTSTIGPPDFFGCDKQNTGSHEYSFSTTGEISSLETFLGMPVDGHIHIRSSKGTITIDEKKTNKNIGTIKLESTNKMLGEIKPAISIYLTKKQSVISKLPARFVDNHQPLYYKSIESGFKDEELNLANGNSIKVFVKFNGSCSPKIGGFFKGQVYFDLFGQD